MTRIKLLVLLLVVSLLACRAGTPPTTPKIPVAPQKFGAVVPNGTNVYPRGFYNTAAPTPSNGDSVNLQLDSGGALKVLPDHIDHTADATFNVTIWRQNGGAALATENDPNTTPPAAGAILRISARRGVIPFSGIGSFRLFAKDGTTITCQPWFYDDTIAAWIKFGPTSTVAPVATVLIGSMFGAKFFFQITANTGVTALGADNI